MRNYDVLFATIAVALLSVPISFILGSNYGEGDADVRWRQAAAPVFQNRGLSDISEQATPRDLASYLNPCHAVDHRERQLVYQQGCDDYGNVIGITRVRAEFLFKEDRDHISHRR